MKIAHVINPVVVPQTSDLWAAQPITFESMRIARDFAVDVAAVDLYAIGFPEDTAVFPPDFKRLPPLTRSVLDIAQFQQARRLPLLVDILDALYAASEAEYFVYTNVDIGLQPHFYTAVVEMVAQEHDAFVINRRTIPADFDQPAQLPQMWLQKGAPHRGWDCFIFPRALYPRFHLGLVCLGASRVGLALLSNLAGYGRCFHEYTDAYLTFHLGDERAWRNPAYADYDAFNTRELLQILAKIEADAGEFGRDTIPGSFLWRKRAFGPLYEVWSRHIYLPSGLSQFINGLLRR